MYDDIINQNKLPKSKICPYCYSTSIEKNGNVTRSTYGLVIYMTEQPMKCNVCKGTWVFVFDWRHTLINTRTTT
jgi:transposase-like protein